MTLSAIVMFFHRMLNMLQDTCCALNPTQTKQKYYGRLNPALL